MSPPRRRLLRNYKSDDQYHKDDDNGCDHDADEDSW